MNTRIYFVHWKTCAVNGNYSEGTFTFETAKTGHSAVNEAYDRAQEVIDKREVKPLGEGLIITCISQV